MKKIFLIILLAVVVILLSKSFKDPSPISTEADYKTASYTIEGLETKLTGNPAAYFGNEVRGDFNGDGNEDVAFIITHNPGGSGTFFYLVAALHTTSGYEGTNAVFIGDRIAPQPTEFREGMIVANYADRLAEEPMTATPSVGVSKYFKIENGMLVETSV